MGRPALFERAHFVPAKKQIHLLSSRWYRHILAKAGRKMAMRGKTREWPFTGIMEWLKSTIVRSPVGERSLAELHLLDYHLHSYYMDGGPVVFTIGQQMTYGDPALYLLEVMARKGTEYRFAAVPTPMRVRGTEENAIIMKGQSGGGPCIIQCPAGELVMAGWLHVLNDKDICTADRAALTLQEVWSMHFYKGRDDTEKANQLTFVPSVDFGSWKISRGVLRELPWSDVMLVDELEKFLGGNNENLVEYIKGWQKWCEEKYTKLFAVMWKKEKK
ncbi:hypothetical protein KEM56_007114 [Ascosphaera pollenicola]|nr:hypothetical protein KEM56_007114 [Ascosphaera pollenicola]